MFRPIPSDGRPIGPVDGLLGSNPPGERSAQVSSMSVNSPNEMVRRWSCEVA